MVDLQPCIVGELIDIAPMRDGDWAELFAVASDPAIWELHPAHNRWQEEESREYFATGIASGGALTIRDRKFGGVIGASRYYGYDPEHGEVEIG
jgi:RimJ/RimL family protein N-acetyltransferase